jgi:hypothetical protein
MAGLQFEILQLRPDMVSVLGNYLLILHPEIISLTNCLGDADNDLTGYRTRSQSGLIFLSAIPPSPPGEARIIVNKDQ